MDNNFRPIIWDKSDNHNTKNDLIRSSSTKSLNQVNSNNATMFSSDDESKWTVRNSKINLPAVLNDPTLAKRQTDLFSKNWGESFEKVVIVPSPHIKKISDEDFTFHRSKLLTRLKRNSQSLNNLNPFHEKIKYDILKPEDEQIPKIFFQNEFDLTDHQTYNNVFSLNKQSLKLLQEKLSHYLDLVEVQITKQISMKSESFFTALIAQNELQSYLTRTLSTVSFIRGKVKYLNSAYVEQPLKLLQLVNKRNKYLEVYEKFKLISTIQQTQPMIQSLLSTNDFLGAVDLISTTKETLDLELGGVVCFRHLGSQLLEIERLIERMISEEFSRFITSFLNQPINDLLIEDEPFSMHESFNEEHLVLIILGSLRQHKFELISILQSESSTAIRTLVKQTVIEVVSTLDHTDGDASGLANHMRLLYYEQWMNLMDILFHNLLILLKRIQLICQVFLQVSKSVSQKIPDMKNEIQIDCFAEDNSQTDLPFIHPLLDDYDGLIMNDIASTCDPESASFDGPISSLNVVMSNGDHNSDLDELPEDIPKSIVTSLSEAESFLSSEEHVKITTLLRDCLKFVGDHTQERCQRILVARGKDGFMDKLSVSEFVRLHKCIEANIVKIEKLTHSHSTVLRNNLQNLTSKFVNKFHEERKNKLCLILDNELWKPSQVPVEFQDLVDHILISGLLELPKKKKVPTATLR